MAGVLAALAALGAVIVPLPWSGANGGRQYSLNATLECMGEDEQIYSVHDLPSDEIEEGTGAAGSFDVDVLVGSGLAEVVAIFENTNDDAERTAALVRKAPETPMRAKRNVVLYFDYVPENADDVALAEAIAAIEDCLR